MKEINDIDIKKLYKEACEKIPAGVNSPVRAFKSVNMDYPIFAKSANGSIITDIQDKKYIDYISSWGAMILGHSNKKVVQAISSILDGGFSYGLTTELEVALAQKITSLVKPIEMIRLTVSGTEATMTAIRLSRAYTNRAKILKFGGCYHGHSDSLLCDDIGSGVLTSGLLGSNGIPLQTSENTTTVKYGDIESVKKYLQTNEYACVIIEPIAANMGLVVPSKEFIQSLRKITTETNTLLIFDEVITGFRVALGGASLYFDVIPDLITLGKIIGGGFPLAAFGGKKEIMNMIAPSGDVYHAGTLSGSPIAVTAGLSTLEILEEERQSIYKTLQSKCSFFAGKAREYADKYGVAVNVAECASMFTIFFTDKKVCNLDDAKTSNLENYSKYFRSMLEAGVLLPMSQFEANFIAQSHTDEIIEQSSVAMKNAFKKLASE